jgi:hypothetical protein
MTFDENTDSTSLGTKEQKERDKALSAEEEIDRKRRKVENYNKAVEKAKE